MAEPPPYTMTKNPGGTMTDPDTCPDCGAPVNAPHTEGCDVARCLFNGEQRVAHDSNSHDCGRDVWTGLWPGEAECVEFGWWSVFHGFSKVGGTGWLRCGPDTPGAVPNLSRLLEEAVWDRSAGRWRRREDLVR
jgi:hypothetical protein